MPDVTLKSLTALGHDAPVTETLGPWTLTERFDVALASLAPRRGREADMKAAAKTAGVPLPGAARAEEGEPWSTFWITPEMWMIEAPFATHEDIRARLLAIFGDAASVTEQTDALVRFDLSGAGLERLFERLTNVDLAAMPVGFAARTVVEHMGCYLVKRSDGVTVYGGRSSAESLHHAITVAARSLT